MKKQIMLFVFLLMVAVSTTPSQGSRILSAGRIEGSIQDSETGLPLGRVQVQVGERVVVFTNPEGHFTVSNIAPGSYNLTASKDNYMLARPEGRTLPGRSGIYLTLKPNQKVVQISIQMHPAAVLTGRVFDSHGVPVPSVAVTLYRYTYDDAGLRVLKGCTTNL